MVIGKIMILSFSDAEEHILDKLKSVFEDEKNIEYMEIMPKSVLRFHELEIHVKEQEVYRKGESMNNLLLLEDDIGLIDGLQYSLNKNGFHVDIARTVEEAKICLREINKYDLLVLDVTLPDGTRFDVCEKVRKQNAQIPIIFLTASCRGIYTR